MKFLNKKEQVFDIQLTSYGKHKLSAGDFKPTYYAFFDDNIIYDLEYAGGSEEQNNIHKRIKQDTQYLESQVIFKQLMAGSVVRGGILQDTVYQQDENLFTSQGFIGDARFLSEQTNAAPAWKVIAMQSNITSSALEDTRNKLKIPQINITASYVLESKDPANRSIGLESVRETIDSTGLFSDGRIITLESIDPLIYFEEVNTEMLTENFDIEVFEVINDGATDDDFRRLFFESKNPQIVDGLMVSAQQTTNAQTLTTSSVEYYFTINKDQEVDPKKACKYIDQFNSENYLLDLDFDCSDVDGQDLYFDIYGRVTESEICPD
tara:strand:+ start:163 stop:1128 length:966 start_codon:yes stop_codon:yes gene_type:complete